MNTKTLIFSVLFLLTSPGVQAADPRTQYIGNQLKKFDANSLAFMNEHPRKWRPNGYRGIRTLFTPDLLSSRDFILRKNWLRTKKFRLPFNGGRANPLSDDLARDLVDELKWQTLEDMELARVVKAGIVQSPWSDWYWPIAGAGPAYRYADEKFSQLADSLSWKKIVKYLTEHPNATTVQMSPSEKYDLLVGDTTKGLTRYSMDQGKQYLNGRGSVESWMGICHGWAPASYMLPRPLHSVTVLAADGKTSLEFYPADIKALSSLLWAQADTPSRFIGGRCESKNPRMNRDGRITEPACFDTNPATWHLAIVNQIGRAAQSTNPADQMRTFVMDVTFDYEVWNQPVFGYQYSYFDPRTKKPVAQLKDALVAIKDFKKDKFTKFRSRDAAFVVGIAMDVTYTVETGPSTAKTDAPSDDSIESVQYLYDLELNARHEIIGGEWYQNEHPDFLWTPPAGTRAASAEDYRLTGTWQAGTPVPSDWQKSAPATSHRYGQPLARIVEKLIELSRK